MTERILIVDDELPNRRLLQAILTAEGYEVCHAINGREALAVIAQGGVDLVLLDVLMPEMDGLETCKAIRTELGLSFLPIVMVTALADRESRMRGKAVGADDFLTKPVFEDELLARVTNLLERHRLMRSVEIERARATAEARRWQLVSCLATSVVTCRNYAELEAAAVASLGSALPVCGVSLLETAGEALRPVSPSIPPGSAAALCAQQACSRERWFSALDELPVLMVDAESSEDPLALALRQRGAAQAMVVPLRVGGQVPGVLLLSFARALTAPEQALLEQLAPHLANAAANVRSHVKARELGEARERLATLLVHDFKSPLTVLKANLDVLQAAPLDQNERDEVLDDCDRAIDRLLQLIMDLLDVAKAEEGALILRRVPIDLRDLLEELRSRFQRTAHAYQVSLGVSAERGAFMRGDRQLMVRVLENLVENGLRYAGAGGRLDLSVTATPDGLSLVVENTGASFSDAARTRLFEKYGSTHDPSRSTNRGLGLYFCRLVAEAHGGSVQALPRSSGAAIELSLPMLCEPMDRSRSPVLASVSPPP